ncbi:hypothetical protein GOODEAATRI_014229 [Goodea atripinnis]|uniref:Uncharacterized protein n=1 Tax=Goodea atripinnis TaxID=208336 RepID=A0ABV0MRY8_9TELE
MFKQVPTASYTGGQLDETRLPHCPLGKKKDKNKNNGLVIFPVMKYMGSLCVEIRGVPLILEVTLSKTATYIILLNSWGFVCSFLTCYKELLLYLQSTVCVKKPKHAALCVSV